MSYMDKYKKGGEREKQTRKKDGYTYLNKQCSHDLVAEITSVRKFVSANPKQKGVEKFLVEFKPTKVKKTTQKGKDYEGKECAVGEPMCHLVKLTFPTNEMAENAAFGEMIDIVAACSGKDPSEILRDLAETPVGEPALFDRLLEDDGAAMVGRSVNIVSLKPNDDGFANLEWSGA